MKAKILIVGGGVMGTSIAIRCAQRADGLRAPVVLFEKSEIGAGSSGRSGAILRQFYADKQLALMARDSLREYSAFEARAGLSIGFNRAGVLTLAGPDQAEWRERIANVVEMLSELGIDMRLVRAKEIRSLVPGIKVRNGTVGAWEPGGGYVEPVKTLTSFASLARTYGAVTRLGAAVEEVRTENGRVVGAKTSQGDYQVEQVVLVAGPWTGALLKKLGVELPLRIVRPENHFVGLPTAEGEIEEELEESSSGLSFDIEDHSEKSAMDTLAPRGLHPVLVDLEKSFYCRCEPETRRSRVGRTDYDHDEILAAPEDLSEETSAEMRGWARETLVSRLPDYKKEADAGSIAAWYTLTPDAQPVMGPVPGIEGLFVVSGFSGHGFKLAPSVGEGMAQMLFEEPVTAFDPDFFSPARFEPEVAWTGQFGL